MNDPIADMLIRIKNGYKAGKKTVEFPHSNLLEKISLILAENGYIKDVKTEKKGNKTFIRTTLCETPPFETVERISKLGRRVYVDKNKIPRVLSGLGKAIISTPRGLMTGEKAKRQGLGGELMFKIY